jgi:hypothetical protein
MVLQKWWLLKGIKKLFKETEESKKFKVKII